MFLIFSAKKLMQPITKTSSFDGECIWNLWYQTESDRPNERPLSCTLITTFCVLYTKFLLLPERVVY